MLKKESVKLQKIKITGFFLGKIFSIFLILLFALSTKSFAQTQQVGVVTSYDPTGPNVVVLSPLPQYSNSNITINWTAASNATDYIVEVSTNNSFSSIFSSDTVTVFTQSYSLPDGQYFFRVIPRNSVGNPGVTSNIVSTIVDTTNPVTSATSALIMNNNTQIQINFTATDNLSGIKQVYLYYRFNNGSWINYGSVGNTGSTIFTPSNGTGSYDFFTIGVDNNDNIEVKTPLAEVSISYTVITPTPTPILTPVPTITPSPVITQTPPATLSFNLKIDTEPDSEINVFLDDNLTIQKTLDNTGKYDSNISYDNTVKFIKIIIKDNKGNVIYQKIFSPSNQYNIVTAPFFDNYYLNTTSKQITVTGKGPINSLITLYNFSTSPLETYSDNNGVFSFNLDLNSLPQNVYQNKNQVNFSLYATTTVNDVTSDKSSTVNLIFNLSNQITPTITTSESPSIQKAINEIADKPFIENIGLPENVVENVQTTSQTVFITSTAVGGITLITLLPRILQTGMIFPFVIFFKRQRRFGRVYDIHTRKGIPFATINLYNATTKEFAKSVVSDINGSYSILLPDIKRDYYLEVKHPEYKEIGFEPFKVNVDNEFYSVYSGGIFSIASEINFMIPLYKSDGKFSLRIIYEKFVRKSIEYFKILMFLIFILSGIYFIFTYNVFGTVSFLIYLAIYIIYRFTRIGKRKTAGIILEKQKENATPSTNVFVGVFEGDRQISDTIITDETGKYKVDLKKGQYRIEVNKAGFVLDKDTKAEIKEPYIVIYNVKKSSSGTEIFLKESNEQVI